MTLDDLLADLHEICRGTSPDQIPDRLAGQLLSILVEYLLDGVPHRVTRKLVRRWLLIRRMTRDFSLNLKSAIADVALSAVSESRRELVILLRKPDLSPDDRRAFETLLFRTVDRWFYSMLTSAGYRQVERKGGSGRSARWVWRITPYDPQAFANPFDSDTEGGPSISSRRAAASAQSLSEEARTHLEAQRNEDELGPYAVMALRHCFSELNGELQTAFDIGVQQRRVRDLPYQIRTAHRRVADAKEQMAQCIREWLTARGLWPQEE